VTPGALTLKGATLEADAVKIGAGSLSIESLQDSKVFASKQTNVGVSVSLNGGGQGASGSVSFDQSKEKGAFASGGDYGGLEARPVLRARSLPATRMRPKTSLPQARYRPATSPTPKPTRRAGSVSRPGSPGSARTRMPLRRRRIPATTGNPMQAWAVAILRP
jgi:Hemagglutinin repeat